MYQLGYDSHFHIKHGIVYVYMNTDKRGIVLLAVGEVYRKNFNETFRPSVERYAEKISTQTIIIEEVIRPSPYKIYWQRFLMFSHPKVSLCEKVLMIDSDIYITKHAKNIFDAVSEHPWGACKNNAYDIPRYVESDMNCFESTPLENRPGFLLNGGVYVISKAYKENLERLYEEYAPKEGVGYDMGPLSYFLLNDKKGIILPPEFDTIVSPYLEKYGHSLSSVLEMYDSSSFLHFAASKWKSVFLFIRWFDTTQSSTAKKIVRFFGQKKFDFLTAPLIALLQRIVGSYTYRFKKYFSS